MNISKSKINTFSKRIYKEMKPFISFPKNSKERVILEKRMIAGLTGDRLPDDHLPIGPMTAQRAYIGVIFRKYFEITKSLERIKLAQVFISKTLKIKSVSKIDYIVYHYEYYLNEIYIYNLRVNQLLDFVIKKCRKTNLLKEINKVKAIKLSINKGMEGIKERRGLHVHKKHYDSDKISQINQLHSLSNEFDFIRDYRDSELKIFKKKILSEIKINLDTLETFLEKSIYKEIGTLIFVKLLKSIK